MCFGFGGDQGTTTTYKANPDAIKAGHLALARATGINSHPYGEYGGQRVADFTNDQRAAFGQVRDLNGQPSVLDERLVDQNGKLGKISDYIDPYIAQTLQPAIQNIQQEGAQQRIGIGNNATEAGAFGDARHGIVEGMQMRDEGRNIGDLTAQKYSDAYNAAMAERGADRTSMAAGEQDQMQKALALLGVGDRQQQEQQKQLDVNYNEYQQKQEYRFRQLDALLAFLTGNRTANPPSSTTVDNNNNPFMQLLGSLGGAAISHL